MVDNVAISSGTGTTIATDDVGGVHYQITKIAYGALDTATLASMANPLPVMDPDTTATGTIAAISTSVMAACFSGVVAFSPPLA